MPTYTYRREDGSVFEIEQRITEDPIKVCPTTGQKVKRIINGTAGLLFKGSGFYLTDYAKPKSTNGKDSKDSTSSEKSNDAASSDKTASSSKDSSSSASSNGTSSSSE
jgi:putative FmdB family regulatory protein